MLKPIKFLIDKSRLQKSKNLRLNLSKYEIDDVWVKHDFALLDRYQGFSSEILRLSLIGIGVYAFFFKESSGEILRKVSENSWSKYFTMVSIACLALAVASTLVHRYYSSDFMAYHLRYLRLKEYLDGQPSGSPTPVISDAREEAEKERSDRNYVAQLCELMIACSAFFFGVGIAAMAVSLLTIIIMSTPQANGG